MSQSQIMAILEAIPPQACTLQAADSTILKFDIQTQYNMEQGNVCMVSLKSPTGKVYETKEVPFNTIRHESKYS